MANEGRPTFDLSSFSTFAFPTFEPETPPVDPITPAGGVSPHEQHATSANLNIEALSANKDETLVDLLKFGPPDALAQLTHGLPATLLTVVHNSTETVRAQVDIETGRRRFSKEEVKGHAYRQEDQVDLAKDDKQLDKGKGVEAPQVVLTSARQPSVASDQTDTTFSSPPFYTPSEGATPSEESTTADFESDAGTDLLTAVPTAVRSGGDARPPLAPRPWSASAIPRRRNFIKSIFRKLSDGDTRRQVLRKSVGSLQLKAKLKQVWHREPDTGLCISCFDDVATRELVRLQCHNYCKPCFGRLISHSIESEANWPPKCCLHPISHQKCSKNITGELRSAYKKKRTEYSTPVEHRYYCPITDCGVFVTADKNTKDIAYRQRKCENNHLTCVDCRGRAHSDAVECPKNQDMLGVLHTLAVEEGWRRCYRCHTLVEHRSACRHITCRCGAQFCYVCGKQWWTCGCTELQLNRIKERAKDAAVRRRAQEERERRDIESLRKALEDISKQEAEASVKRERIRVAKEARRRSQVQHTYADYTTMLEDLNDFQSNALNAEHQRTQDHLTLKTRTTVESVQSKHEDKLAGLKASSEAQIEKKSQELEQLWLDLIAERLKAGEGHENVPEIQWNAVQWDRATDVGEPHQAQVPEPPKSAYEQEIEGHSKRKNDTLERLHYVLAEEVAIQQELMDARKARIVESFQVQARELRLKIQSEVRWLELVFIERRRLLDEFMGVELADEILDDADERWNSILVKEETVEAGPSRFDRASQRVSAALRHQQGLSQDQTDSAGPPSPRPESSTREPTPPPWIPLSLGSALHAAWDSTWDAYWNPRAKTRTSESGSGLASPNRSTPPTPPRASARAPQHSGVPQYYPQAPPVTPSEERPPTPEPWTSLLDAIRDFLIEAPPRVVGRER